MKKFAIYTTGAISLMSIFVFAQKGSAYTSPLSNDNAVVESSVNDGDEADYSRLKKFSDDYVYPGDPTDSVEVQNKAFLNEFGKQLRYTYSGKPIVIADGKVQIDLKPEYTFLSAGQAKVLYIFNQGNDADVERVQGIIVKGII